MKKTIIFIGFILGLIFAFSSFTALAANGLSLEKINDFDVTIRMNRDSTINVSERINYDFGSLSKHGIYRDIPISYSARGGNYSLRINDISVTDENNSAYRFESSISGDDMRIKVGDPDILVNGKKTYVINYKIGRAMNYFNSHDELYWNATGDKWQIGIDKAEVKVILPEKVAAEKLQKECFAGTLGSISSCSNSGYFPNENEVEEVRFRQDSPLEPGDGLTIVVGVPKGTVVAPSMIESAFAILWDNLVLAVPFIVFWIMFYLWYTRGRDPQASGTIIAQFDAPDRLTPGEVGTIIDEKADNEDISSNIINLAIRGYLRITRTEEKGIYFTKSDYILERLKSENDLEDFDKKLMQGMFRSGPLVKVSKLRNHFYNDLALVKRQLYAAVTSKGYFSGNPSNVRVNYGAAGVIIIILTFLIGPIFLNSMGVLAFFSFVASGVIVIFFSAIMPARTKKGADAKEYILGLKEYLRVAEKDRINFHNAPEKNPAQFEKLLPYAMVLGVEKEWAKQFEGIYNESPAWYRDSTGVRGFNSLILANSLAGFSHYTKSNLSAVPQGASQGRSGFGGGGHSGGGFGGGGGGSW